MLGAVTGTAVPDHWQPYGQDDTCPQAWCNAPHLREWRCMATQYQPAWAKDMTVLLLAITAAVHATPAPAMRWAPPEIEAFAQRYDAMVQAGLEANPAPVSPPAGEGRKRGRLPHPPAVHLLSRRRDVKGEVLAFMDDFRVPFDNNQGERDRRMVQVKQQISGGLRTLEGAKRFGRIRGSISTARKHAKNIFEAIRDAFDGTPFLPSPATH
jgi:transposase